MLHQFRHVPAGSSDVHARRTPESDSTHAGENTFLKTSGFSEDHCPRSCFGLVVLVLCWLFAANGMAGDQRFDWRRATELAPGILYTQIEVELPAAEGLTCPHFRGFDPSMARSVRMFAARIDGNHPEIRFTTTFRAPNWGKPMPGGPNTDETTYRIRTERQTTREFIATEREAGRNVVLAINAAPWSPFTPGVNYPFADNLGLAIANGELVSPPNGQWPSLLIDTAGRPHLQLVESIEGTRDFQLAVSGFSFSLTDGQLPAADTVLHPRTGIGICADQRFVFLLAIDGRQAASQGATVREVGEWLLYFGAHNALNMDGGGSTTMARFNPDSGAIELLNRPAHGERSNGNNLGVYLP